jgi:hypothetical protein
MAQALVWYSTCWLHKSRGILEQMCDYHNGAPMGWGLSDCSGDCLTAVWGLPDCSGDCLTAVWDCLTAVWGLPDCSWDCLTAVLGLPDCSGDFLTAMGTVWLQFGDCLTAVGTVWLQWGLTAVWGLPDCSPQPLQIEILKKKFCTHDHVSRLAWVILQPKLATEICWWLIS